MLEVLDKATAVDLWTRLEELYMTKSLANKIRLKETLYTFRMIECTPIQKHALPPSYKHFKEIMLYSNSNTISFEDSKSNLLSKEKFDLDIHVDSAEGLVVRGKTEKGSGKNRSKSKNPHAGKTCNYCGKLGHIIANCWQLQKKREKEEDNSREPAETFVC